MDTFFVREGERFRATEFTRGPWSDDAQHGGPPAALLARAIERAAVDGFVARLTVEFLKPVPLATFTVQTTLIRPGKRVRLFQSSLVQDGTELVRATGLVLAESQVPLPLPPPRAPLPGPDTAKPFEFSFFRSKVGYHTAIEGRSPGGQWGKGRFSMWMRMKVALVDGETPSPLERVVVAADAGNGVSAALPVDKFTFINPDLTVHLHKRMHGEWILLDATTVPELNGVGLAQSELRDPFGTIGRSLQSLIVSAR